MWTKVQEIRKMAEQASDEYTRASIEKADADQKKIREMRHADGYTQILNLIAMSVLECKNNCEFRITLNKDTNFFLKSRRLLICTEDTLEKLLAKLKSEGFRCKYESFTEVSWVSIKWSERWD